MSSFIVRIRQSVARLPFEVMAGAVGLLLLAPPYVVRYMHRPDFTEVRHLKAHRRKPQKWSKEKAVQYLEEHGQPSGQMHGEDPEKLKQTALQLIGSNYFKNRYQKANDPELVASLQKAPPLCTPEAMKALDIIPGTTSTGNSLFERLLQDLDIRSAIGAHQLMQLLLSANADEERIRIWQGRIKALLEATSQLSDLHTMYKQASHQKRNQQMEIATLEIGVDRTGDPLQQGSLRHKLGELAMQGDPSAVAAWYSSLWDMVIGYKETAQNALWQGLPPSWWSVIHIFHFASHTLLHPTIALDRATAQVCSAPDHLKEGWRRFTLYSSCEDRRLQAQAGRTVFGLGLIPFINYLYQGSSFVFYGLYYYVIRRFLLFFLASPGPFDPPKELIHVDTDEQLEIKIRDAGFDLLPWWRRAILFMDGIDTLSTIPSYLVALWKTLKAAVEGYFNNAKMRHRLYATTFSRLRHLNTLASCMQELDKICREDPRLQKELAIYLKPIRRFLRGTLRASRQGTRGRSRRNRLTHMVRLFRGMSQGPITLLEAFNPFSSRAYVLYRTYNIMQQLTDEERSILADAVAAFYKLEVLINLATRLRQSQLIGHRSRPFTLGEILPDGTACALDVRDMYSSRLVSGTTVKNDYIGSELVGDGKKLPVMVLTGYNGSGKSVYMRALGETIYLFQALGCSTCSSGKFPLFDGMIMILPAWENISQNLSSFMVQSLQMKDVMEKADHLKKAVILIDEPLQTTNEDESIALLLPILLHLYKSGDHLVSITSHLNRLQDLVKLHNYGKVFTFFTTVFDFVRSKFTYQVVPGHLERPACFPILEDQKFPPHILREAAQNLLHIPGYPHKHQLPGYEWKWHDWLSTPGADLGLLLWLAFCLGLLLAGGLSGLRGRSSSKDRQRHTSSGSDDDDNPTPAYPPPQGA